MSVQVAEIFDKMAQLGLALGVRAICDYEGCWIQKVDDNWRFAMNGHEEAVTVTSEQMDGGMGATIQPFEAAVFYNGWLAGSMSPIEGIIAAGEGANEDTFIAALDAAIERARQPDERQQEMFT